MFFFGAQRRSNANVSSWQRNMSNESPYTHYTVTRISKNGWVSDFISKHMYRLLRVIFPCKTQDHILLLKKNKSHFQVHRWENQMWILDWEACKHDSRMRPQWLHATNVHSLYRDVPRIWLLFFLHLKLMVAVKLCSPGRSQNCKSVGLGNDIVHGEKQYSTDRNLKCTSLSPPSRMFFTTAACAAGSRSS